jgi:hypothetical protein
MMLKCDQEQSGASVATRIATKGELSLLFCDHHTYVNGAALTAEGWDIQPVTAETDQPPAELVTV